MAIERGLDRPKSCYQTDRDSLCVRLHEQDIGMPKFEISGAVPSTHVRLDEQSTTVNLLKISMRQATCDTDCNLVPLLDDHNFTS